MEVVARFPELGSKTTGAEFEPVVKGANKIWNQNRLQFLKRSGSPKDLLRPLFCSPELNLDNGAEFASPVAGGTDGSPMEGVPFDSMLDPHLRLFGFISTDPADYDAAIKANGQFVEGVDGAVDTVIDYVFPERANIDNEFVDELKAAGIVDDEFVKDVLLIDFTRPLFSKDRCDLLKYTPALTNDLLNPEALRDGFISNLEAAGVEAGTPDGDLLANLKATGGQDRIVTAFTAACSALPGSEFLRNALTVTSLNRDLARARPVIEAPATMPDDNLEVAQGTRLDPVTCQLTTRYVSLVTP
jgi:hypothetical protein